MIKYAHRGLVEGGTISSLFEKLYLLLVATMTGLFYSFSFSRNVKEKFLYRLCISEEIKYIEFNSVKTATMLFAFTMSMAILYSLLYFSCTYLIRKNRLSVIGYYQRNVLTLNDTYMLALVNQISGFIGILVASIFKFSPESIRFGYFFVDISMIVIIGYILPVYVLVKLYFKMPEFYSNKSFNRRKPFQKQANILIPRAQYSPFSHLPYVVLRRVKHLQEQPPVLYEKKLPKILVSPPV